MKHNHHLRAVVAFTCCSFFAQASAQTTAILPSITDLDDDIEIESGFLPEFNFDIKTETEKIHQTVKMAEPLQEAYTSSVSEIAPALKKAKSDPSRENINNLESAFANGIRTVYNGITSVLKNEDYILDAFGDINSKFVEFESKMSIDIQNLLRRKANLELQKQELQKLAAEKARLYMQDKSKDVKDELMSIKHRLDLFDHDSKALSIDIHTSKNIMGKWTGARVTYEELGRNFQHLFSKLGVESDRFERLVIRRDRGVQLRDMVHALFDEKEGLHHTAMAVQSVYSSVTEFTGVIEDIEGFLNDSLSTPGKDHSDVKKLLVQNEDEQTFDSFVTNLANKY